MRDSKQLLGVLAFLTALPAWASDMCEIGMVFLIPPALLMMVVTWFVGLTVRKPTAAIIWGVLLLLCAVPAVGGTVISMGGAFHGEELKHEGMFNASAIVLLMLLAMYAWSYARLYAVIRQPRNPRVDSQPV